MPERSSSDPFGPAQDWGRIRSWDGSKYRAFEELCFQLHETPPGLRTIKTGDPDAGVEWYDIEPSGRAYGFQTKFVATVEDLIKQGKGSARAVGANKRDRNIVKLTFLAPFDMPDPASRMTNGRNRVGARKKWQKAVDEWRSILPGLADVEITFVSGGELLKRLNRPGNEGRRWFFFNDVVLGHDWCQTRLALTLKIADERYTPGNHVPLYYIPKSWK